MKNRSFFDSIEVNSPCSQDWDSMRGNDEVRFCDHCVKHVHDLSAMTRSKAQKFVADAKGSVCVRYLRPSEGKIETVGNKLYQISGRASRVAAGLFGVSLTLASSAASSAYAQGDISLPRAQEAAIRSESRAKRAEGEKIANSIHGSVADPNGAFIQMVTVTLIDKKSGARRTVQSNNEGRYDFSGVIEGSYDLKFEMPGFRSHTIENIDFDGLIDAKYDVNLDVGMVMGAMVILPNYENQLVLAVQDNDIQRIKELIGRGMNVNEKDNNGGLTAFHLAVQEGKADIVELLLGAGAKVNARNKSGRTALMMIAENYEPPDETDRSDSEEAAEDGDEDAAENGAKIESAKTPAKTPAEMFQLLINHGAKVNLRDSEGMTALIYAAQKGAPELLRLLIAHRADIDVQAKNGRTALMEAVNEDETENVKILLEAGAKVDLKDDEGETAMSLCTDDDIEQLLLAHGAIRPAEAAEPPEPEAK